MFWDLVSKGRNRKRDEKKIVKFANIVFTLEVNQRYKAKPQISCSRSFSGWPCSTLFAWQRNMLCIRKKRRQKKANGPIMQIAGTALFTPPTALWAFPSATLLAAPNYLNSTLPFALFFPSLPLTPTPPPPFPPPLAEVPFRPCLSVVDLFDTLPPSRSFGIRYGCCSCSPVPVVEKAFPIKPSNGSLVSVCSASPSFKPLWMPGIDFSLKDPRM